MDSDEFDFEKFFKYPIEDVTHASQSSEKPEVTLAPQRRKRSVPDAMLQPRKYFQLLRARQAEASLEREKQLNCHFCDELLPEGMVRISKFWRHVVAHHMDKLNKIPESKERMAWIRTQWDAAVSETNMHVPCLLPHFKVSDMPSNL